MRSDQCMSKSTHSNKQVCESVKQNRIQIWFGIYTTTIEATNSKFMIGSNSELRIENSEFQFHWELQTSTFSYLNLIIIVKLMQEERAANSEVLPCRTAWREIIKGKNSNKKRPGTRTGRRVSAGIITRRLFAGFQVTKVWKNKIFNLIQSILKCFGKSPDNLIDWLKANLRLHVLVYKWNHISLLPRQNVLKSR